METKNNLENVLINRVNWAKSNTLVVFLEVWV
jgi:hypothetical protein